MARRSRPLRYQPLADYLAAQPGDAVHVSFAEIERILGGPLPALAYTRNWWWSRQPRTPRPLLARVGWRTAAVELWEQRVTFERGAVAG